MIGSAGFYWHICEHSPRRFCMLLGAALLVWGCSLLLSRLRTGRKLLFVLALALSAGPLLLIKELPFLTARSGNSDAFAWLPVPVGIAFYSLQLIAYTADVYCGRTRPEQNPLKFYLFVGFFPQILQGPIPRYNQLAPQLIEGHRFNERGFTKGFMLILWAFFLKLCIADKAAVVVDTIFGSYPAYGGVYVLIAGILYSFQLYTDFLSCTTFAQGIAELFGIHIIDNFHRPYFATSVKDFWRRWHISLSSWLRDYIYIPFGGNRKGTVRKFLNLLLTFSVSGMWHGAGYKFLFWGLLHGTYQIAEALTAPFRDFFARRMGLQSHPGFRTFWQRLITFVLVMLAWIIFRAEHLRDGLSMIRSIFTVHNPWILTNDALFTLGLSGKEWIVLCLCLAVLAIVSCAQERGLAIRDRILACNLLTRWSIYIGTILFVLIFGTYGFGFNAQAFIYGGF